MNKKEERMITKLLRDMWKTVVPIAMLTLDLIQQVNIKTFLYIIIF